MKLFKRSPDRTAPYYARFQVRGKAYLWSTKTEDMALARKRAKEYHDAIVSESFHLVDGMKSRSGATTFDELMADYATFPSPEDHTRTINRSALVQVLKASGLNGADTIDRIGADLAINWQKYGRRSNVPVATINSVLRRARSLFSKGAMILYGADRPSADRVRDLFTVPALREPERRPELPSPEADRKAHETLPATPDLWRAFLLARYGGLRAGEIMAARKDWIEGGVIYVGGREFVAKSRRWRPVALPPFVVDVLMASPVDYLVGEHPQQAVGRDLPAALQACGFPARKPTHSLRRLFGSTVYTQQGPRQARDALGHSTQAVTDKHYARSMDAPLAIAYAG